LDGVAALRPDIGLGGVREHRIGEKENRRE
jgi:hypothetical protein